MRPSYSTKDKIFSEIASGERVEHRVLTNTI
jgi:hypothetical protein